MTSSFVNFLPMPCESNTAVLPVTSPPDVTFRTNDTFLMRPEPRAHVVGVPTMVGHLFRLNWRRSSGPCHGVGWHPVRVNGDGRPEREIGSLSCHTDGTSSSWIPGVSWLIQGTAVGLGAPSLEIRCGFWLVGSSVVLNRSMWRS